MNARDRITPRNLVIGFLGIGIFPATYLAQPAPEADAVAPTSVNHYESPCQFQARTSRDIPAYSVHPGQGLLAWTRQHLRGSTPDAELADYWGAMDACKATDPGKFQWDQMILVDVEYLP